MNAYRVGYGSDTEGPEQFRVTAATTTTRERAMQNLMARIPQYQANARKRISAAVWDGLNVNQQAALTSLDYNYGDIPARVRVYPDQPKKTAADIEALGSDNGGINRKRRATEAAFYLKPVTSSPTPPVVATGGISGALAVLLGQIGASPVAILALVGVAIICGLSLLWVTRKRPSSTLSLAARLKQLIGERDGLDAQIAALTAEYEQEKQEIETLLKKGLSP